MAKPGLRAAAWPIARVSRPAPTSSTVVTAIWATNRPLRQRVPAGVEPRRSAESEVSVSRVACSAGARPATTAVTLTRPNASQKTSASGA